MTLTARIRQWSDNNQFAHSVLALTSGTAAAQLIVVLASPVLTRLYSPAQFGELTLFMSVLGVLAAICAFRFELAIPIPRDERVAVSLVVVSIIALAAFTVAVSVLSALFGKTLVRELSAETLNAHLWMLPLALFVTGLFMILNMWCNRQNQFGEIAKSLSMVLVQIVGSSLGGASLIGGRIVGLFLATFLLTTASLRSGFARDKLPRLKELRKAVSDYRRFPLVQTWVGLTSSASVAIPPLLFAWFYDLQTAGAFGLTIMILVAPMSLIGNAVENVFYRQAILAHRDGVLHQLMLAVHERLVVVSLPVFLLGFTLLPEAFTVIFGDNWEQAGVFASFVLPWMFLQFTTTPCTNVFPILDKHWTALWFQLSLAVAPIFAFAFGEMFVSDPSLVVAVLSFLSCLVYLSRLSIAYKAAGVSLFSGLAVLLRAAPYSFVCVLPLVMFRGFAEGSLYIDFFFVLAFTTSLALCFATIWMRWIRLRAMPN